MRCTTETVACGEPLLFYGVPWDEVTVRPTLVGNRIVAEVTKELHPCIKTSKSRWWRAMATRFRC